MFQFCTMQRQDIRGRSSARTPDVGIPAAQRKIRDALRCVMAKTIVTREACTKPQL